MRDLDKRAMLAGDFVVVYGDVVANVSLQPALAAHRARRAADKNAIMTMVLRESAHGSRARSPVFVLDPARQRCLQYEQLSWRGTASSLLVDDDILLHSGAQDLEIRHDLVDCGIDICTPDVLALWSDNFDYEAPRRGFLHSVLKDYELNGKTIHTHIERRGYANRVRDLSSYAQISQDVLGRWTWPLCPDGAFAADHGCVTDRGFAREDGVKVAKTARIRQSFVGHGSTIAADAVVRNSVVGRNCTVGPGAVLDHAYLWDGVGIGAGARVSRAIVAGGARIGAGAVVGPGALVGWDAVVPDGAEQAETGAKLAPTLSNSSHASEDSDEGAAALLPALARSLSQDSISTLASDASSEPPAHHRTLSGTSHTSAASDPLDGPTKAASDFHTDAYASIYDSLLRGDDPANINLELQALRLALNASEHAVRKAVVAALVAYVVYIRDAQKALAQGAPKGPDPRGGKPAPKTAREIIASNGDLVRRVVFDLDAPQKADQVDLLLLAQRELAGAPDAEIVMLSFCNGLYAEDLVQGEALVQWWADPRASETPALRHVQSHGSMAQLIAIAGDEDESDEDEDEDESEDESD